jgi:hypothetical protein
MSIFEQPCILKIIMEKLSMITDFVSAVDQPQGISDLVKVFLNLIASLIHNYTSVWFED